MLRRRALVWHPLLFAVWPVVSSYRENVNEVPVAEALRLAGIVAAGSLALLLLMTLVLRDARRAGLVASVVVLTVMLWGGVRDAVGDPPWLIVAWLTLAAAAVIVFIRAVAVAKELTTIASVLAVVVLTLALIPLLSENGPALASAWVAPVGSENLDDLVGEWSADGEPRDIFYLVFDRYGSQASMEQRFGMDLAGFFDGLRKRGFRVTPDSKANHLRTAQSLASTLNLDYHHDLTRRYGRNTGNLLPIYDQLRDHAVGRLLRARGYEYVHIGPWWDPTQENPHADVNFAYTRTSDFELELFRSTLLSRFQRRPQGASLREQYRRVPYDGALQQFRDLRRAAQRTGPTFVFAHVLLPHEPFVFDADGDYVDVATEASRTRNRNYTEQTTYTNKLITALLDDIVDVPEDERPIVVVAADEGPHPVRFLRAGETFDWTEATDAELREKFSVLNAYLLPGVEDPGLYDSISGVNTWRLIFNTYFAGQLPLLDDRSYVFRDESHVYDFTDVTDRLR